MSSMLLSSLMALVFVMVEMVDQGVASVGEERCSDGAKVPVKWRQGFQSARQLGRVLVD